METLQTSVKKCVICKSGDVIEKSRPAKEGFVIYGRNGARQAVHKEKRCNFRNYNFECGAGYYYGYLTYNGMKMVSDNALKNPVLITSSQTAFDMDYLVEFVSRVQISSTTFEGAAKEFNRFHNLNLPYDVTGMRIELNRQRIAEAYYFYTYLEYGQRYKIKDYQIIKNSLDEAILEHKVEMLAAYRERWTVKNECDRPECKVAKKTGEKFKIKWIDFPAEEATWESESCVAKFIQEYYSDPSKLGCKLPEPVIKHTKTIGDSQYHYLGWTGEKGGRWLGEEFFKIASEDGGVMSTIKNTCGTRKSRDKRVKAASLGLLIGAYPCGTVPLFDELFNSEGIAQVHGILMEYLATVSDKEKLEFVIYDDACHLAKYSMNEKVADRNKTTKFFSERKFVIDKFHFRNHVDPWCHQNCDPNEVPELDGMNTEICEQMFRSINQKKNCKGMNEAHFFLFWLYNLEMHNLEMAGMDRTEPNPLCVFRWENLEVNPVDFDSLPEKFSASVEDLASSLSSVSISTAVFKCELCPAGYKTAGHLTKHMQSKHPSDLTGKVGECLEICGQVPCGKVLSSARALAKHIKTIHKTCSVCNEEFESHNEKAKHMLVHTYCYVCEKNFHYESKLKRHNQQKH